MDDQQQETTENVPNDEAAVEAPEVAAPDLPEVSTESAEQVVADAPTVEEIVASAEPAEQIIASEPDVAEVVAEEAPVEDIVADAPSAEEVIAEAEAADPATPPAEGGEEQGDGKKKRSRRRKGSKAAEQWGVSPTRARGIANQVDITSPGAPQQGGGGRPQRGGGGGGGGGGRSREPLPFDQLRAAAEAVVDMEGSRKALRDAFVELAPRERNDISALVSNDGDFRQRARSISAGSLAARKIGKALAAQTIAIANIEDMWAVTLSKEEAAERQSRIRAAKNRDRDRARRNEERNNRADRISREDLAKAQDGRVGAQIRFVIQGEDEKRDRKKGKKDEPAKKTTANDLLDRLGY